MSKVLFEITEDHLETGLRGYPVGFCPTSSVDPQKGLFYVGRPVAELADRSPYEVMFLLYKGKEGTKEELEAFTAQLKERSVLHEELRTAIGRLPRNAHPMTLLSMALMELGAFQGKSDYAEDCLTVMACMPELVARVINHHAGWTNEITSDPSLGYMENFVHMLGVKEACKPGLTPVMRLFNVLHYDHGGGNLSTFVGKAIASGGESLFGSLSGAMCALAGPLHGKANQDNLLFLNRIQESLGSEPKEEEVEAFLREALANREKIYGFGHAVLRVEDPRATVQYAHAEAHYPQDPLVKLALLLRRTGKRVLGENPKIQNPNPNVDAISGSLLSAAGFPYPEYFTVLFGLSRCVGIAIQIVYERCVARGGKGTPIVRPKYFYRAREER